MGRERIIDPISSRCDSKSSKEVRELMADRAIHAERITQKNEKQTRLIQQLAKEKVLHISGHLNKMDKSAIIQLLEELIRTQQTESAYLYEWRTLKSSRCS
jgi:hypothetical protein